mgnify:CR=1 FL=1
MTSNKVKAQYLHRLLLHAQAVSCSMLAWRWISLCAAAANAFVVPAGPPRLTLRSPPAAAVADYSFMLPASTAVATCCQLCGIGGAALFSPIFLLVRVRRPSRASACERRRPIRATSPTARTGGRGGGSGAAAHADAVGRAAYFGH